MHLIFTLIFFPADPPLQAVIDERDFLYSHARRPGTLRTYSNNFNIFAAFCSDYGFTPNRIDPPYVFNLISLYIAWLCLRELAFGTIRVHLYAARAFYMDMTNGVLDITSEYTIQQIIRAVKLKIGNRPKPKLAFTIQMLLEIFSKLGSSAVDVRDWAAFVTAFFGLLRRSELVSIKWKHLEFLTEGIRIFLPISKTDPYHRGMWICIGRRNDHLCPVAAISRLFALMQPAFARSDQFVFASHAKGTWSASNLSGSAFSKRVKKWVEAIGLDPADFAGHSFRRGGATALFNAGIPTETIQLQGRWRSDCYKIYLEHSPKTFFALSCAL